MPAESSVMRDVVMQPAGTAPAPAAVRREGGSGAWGRAPGHAPARALPFDTVTVATSLADAEAAWRSLERRAAVSPYQTFAWARAWLDTEGAAMGVAPRIGLVHDAERRLVAVLPFGLRRRGLLALVGFLGGRHANYNLGLFAPGIAWDADAMRALVRAFGSACPERVDVLALVAQPAAWDGHANPFALLPNQESPSRAHRAALPASGDAYLKEHLSGAARKKLRSKTSQLEALGAVVHVVATTEGEIEAVLEAHVAQKRAKLASLGADRDGSALARARAVFARAAAGEERPLELHALRCGERIVATFGGLRHNGRFSGLLISHEGEPAIARLSPGEILLAAVTRKLCADGLTSFDLGIGEARYKGAFCPIVDVLFDSLLPASPLGQLYVAVEAARLGLKREIKQSDWAWPLAVRLRRRLSALRRQG